MRLSVLHAAATRARGARRGGRLSCTRGQAFVETAIAVLVLLGCVFAVVEAALIFWTYITLENGITEATRYAITQQQIDDPDNPGTLLSRIDSIKFQMRKESPGITIADSEFQFENLTDGTGDAGGANDMIRITVSHPYQPLFPIPFGVVASSNLIAVRSTMKNEPPPS